MDFTVPEFLENRSPEDFMAIMKETLPADIDLSEGGYAWDFTMPTAIVAARLCEFVLPEVLKIVFPEWSYGEYLDGHAKGRGITRRAATASTGEITITGESGTVIPAGSLFSVASTNGNPSIDYMTIDAVTIPDGGSVTAPVQCTQAGTIGNTGIGTVVLVSSKLTKVTSVTNEEAITGGTEEESDESLKQRISDYDQSQGENYTGCPADYKRWATSVDGVGDATVISAKDDTGLVTIILTDSNGSPATETLCQAVYNYIMRPDDEGERLAPINANLSVTAPSTVAIGIKATVELTSGATIESVKSAFLAQLALYLPLALEEGEVKYTRIAAALASVNGANDYKDLQIGVKSGTSITYGTANIPVTTGQLPTIAAEDMIFTSGTV